MIDNTKRTLETDKEGNIINREDRRRVKDGFRDKSVTKFVTEKNKPSKKQIASKRIEREDEILKPKNP
jgi:hypothetical protein